MVCVSVCLSVCRYTPTVCDSAHCVAWSVCLSVVIHADCVLDGGHVQVTQDESERLCSVRGRRQTGDDPRRSTVCTGRLRLRVHSLHAQHYMSSYIAEAYKSIFLQNFEMTSCGLLILTS